MVVILYYAAIICAFAFPAFLISAVRSSDWGKAVRNTVFACSSFGIIVVALLILCMR